MQGLQLGRKKKCRPCRKVILMIKLHSIKVDLQGNNANHHDSWETIYWVTIKTYHQSFFITPVKKQDSRH